MESYRFTANLPKRPEADAIRRSNNKFRVAVLVSQAALRFIDGLNLSSDYTVPEEVKAAGFKISADELRSIVEGHDVEKLRIHGGVKNIADKLSTSINDGISTSESSLHRRKEIYGINKFAESPWQFKDLDRKKKKTTVQVTRNGSNEKISIYDLLPGDIVLLSMGDQVPADGLFISGLPLLIDESILTRAREPVNVNGTNPFLLSGTTVQDGFCKMLVTTVGMRTQWGKLMAARSEGGDDESPLLVKPDKTLGTTDFTIYSRFLSAAALLHILQVQGFSKPKSHRSIEFPTATQIRPCAVNTSENDLIKQLVLDLESSSIVKQKEAAKTIKMLAKNSSENRIRIAEAGAIKPLILIMSSSDPKLQEYGVTAILNLSICTEHNKKLIVSLGAIKPLTRALRIGTSTAKENAACALLHLSSIEENKVVIGQSEAILLLVKLLENGRLRGKKDASECLYSLCSVEENKILAVQLGIMKPLVELMTNFESNMVDQSALVMSVLVSEREARTALVNEGGIPALVEIIKLGSQMQKEIAVTILLQVCEHDLMHCTMVSIVAIPPLVALSQAGTNCAKQKAETLIALLQHTRAGGDTDGGSTATEIRSVTVGDTDGASTATERRLLRCPKIRRVTGRDTDGASTATERRLCRCPNIIDRDVPL